MIKRLQKTRLVFKDSRQEVTGLVVNQKLNVPHSYVRETRAMAHQLYLTGEFQINGIPGTLNQLEGRFSFIDQLDKYNNKRDTKINKVEHKAYTLCGREKEYRKFLFYRYFFSISKPLVMTEGKTDIRYIKSALKKLYQRYPTLIERNSDGTFHFKISFFKRTRRWSYLTGISLDGADSMKILYRYFTTTKGYTNYIKCFEKLSGHKAKNPVIFLYDNETVSKQKRPLKTFISEFNISETNQQLLQKNLYLRLVDDEHVFLLTNPLKVGSKESEIEELFPQSTLDIELDGKKFTRKDKYSQHDFYGKDTFSKYISSHYKEINFDGFIPLLDALDNIVQCMNEENASQN